MPDLILQKVDSPLKSPNNCRFDPGMRSDVYLTSNNISESSSDWLDSATKLNG